MTIKVLDGIYMGLAQPASGGGTTINNEDINVTENGVYTASEGYTGLGTVGVDVPQYEEKTVTNKTGSSVAKYDKVWVDGSNLTSYYDMANPNFSLVGSPTVTNGVASGFSTSDYIKPLCMFQNAYQATSVWEWRTKIRLTTLDVFNPVLGGSSGTYLPDLFVGTSNRIGMNLSGNGSSYNICELAMGTTTLTTNTDYWVKWGWTGTVYYIDISTDGTNYTREVSVNSTSFVYSYNYSNNPLMIGFRVGEYFRGSIDLKETSFSVSGTNLNVDYIWRSYDVLVSENTTTGVALEAIANNASGKVAIGEIERKYGATINNFLGDVDSNGVLENPSNVDFVFNGVKDVVNNRIEGRYSSMPNIKSISFPDLENITRSSSMKSMFGKETIISNDALVSISFPKLKSVTGSFGMMTCFGGRENFNNFDSTVFPELETISGGNVLNKCFYYNRALTSAIFPKLKEINGGNIFSYCFGYCTSLTTVSFPALKSTSFGSYTNQFNNMLLGCTGVTVHFPSNLQSVIGSWSDVTAGFGGTNTTVLFDLTATE